MSVSNIQFAYINPTSPVFQKVIEMRYKTFFEPFLLKKSEVEDEKEEDSLHLIAKTFDDVILGYVRITIENGEASISQMIVDETIRKKGLGRELITKVLEKVRSAGIKKIVLNSRLNSLKFYEKMGFISKGEVFSSRKTGLLHIRMEKRLE